MPLSKEAHAVMFTRSLCADELEAALAIAPPAQEPPQEREAQEPSK